MQVKLRQCSTIYIQRITVSIDIIEISVEFRDKAVAGERPGAGGIQRHGNFPCLRGNYSAGGVDDAAVNGALKGRTVRQLKCKYGIVTYLDAAEEILRSGLDKCLVAVSLPAIGTDGEQDVVTVLVCDTDVPQRDDRVGVGDMEDVTVFAGQTSVVLHCKNSHEIGRLKATSTLYYS